MCHPNAMRTNTWLKWLSRESIIVLFHSMFENFGWSKALGIVDSLFLLLPLCSESRHDLKKFMAPPSTIEMAKKVPLSAIQKTPGNERWSYSSPWALSKNATKNPHYSNTISETVAIHFLCMWDSFFFLEGIQHALSLVAMRWRLSIVPSPSSLSFAGVNGPHQSKGFSPLFRAITGRGS